MKTSLVMRLRVKLPFVFTLQFIGCFSSNSYIRATMSDKIVRCSFASDDAIVTPNEGFGETVWKAIEKHRGKVAVVMVGGDATITYDEMISKAELLAGRLLSQGCQQHDVIAIFSPNSINWMLVLLAALRIGAIPATINSLLTPDELRHHLTACSAKFLFTTSSLATKTLDVGRSVDAQVLVMEADCSGCINIGTTLLSNTSLHLLPSFKSLHQQLNDVALILFSSGTTGKQKAVLLSHRNMQYKFQLLMSLDAADDKIQLVASPMSHIAGFSGAVGGLIHGTAVHIMSKFDLEDFLRTVEENKLERLSAVPPILTLMVKSPLAQKYRLTHLREIISGAAPISAELETLLIQKFPRVAIRQAYGMTETAGLVTGVLQGQRVRKPGTVGVVQPGVYVKVIDIQTGESLGPGSSGELCVKSPLNMLGYANNQAALDATIDRDGWLHTGDIGYYDEDGYFFIVDRLKELIKYKAYQVAPAELEAVLLSHPEVADAGVVGIPDPLAGELPFACVVRKSSATVSEDDLKQFVDGRVAAYKRLRGGVRFVSVIPKSASGKILRRELKAAFAKGKL